MHGRRTRLGHSRAASSAGAHAALGPPARAWPCWATRCFWAGPGNTPWRRLLPPPRVLTWLLG
eukprot:scaffold693_cov399-Prasinococcus_capsulatus_cf.AAC.14